MTQPDGYLRAYDEDLDGALELVVRDVETAGYDRGQAERIVRERAEFATAFMSSRAGGEIALHIMQGLQDDIVEKRADHVWPVCPEHPNHPLWIEPVNEPTAMWRCQTSGRTYARLGGLRELHA